MNETTEQIESAYKGLRVLAIVQLSVFTVILSWMLVEMSMGFTLGGLESFPVFMYALGAITLVPSALVFINSPTVRNLQKILSAKLAQRALFVSCCIALLPSAILAMARPPFLLASIAGILFHLFLLPMLKTILPTPILIPTPIPAEYGAAKLPTEPVKPGVALYCSKCGAPLGPKGTCPSCA